MKEVKSISISLFWFLIVFHLDPGGFLHSHVSQIGRTLFSFASLILGYLIFYYYYNQFEFNQLSLKFLRHYFIFIIVWLIYYFVIHYGIRYAEFPGVALSIARNPDVIFKSFIVIPITYLTIFSLKTFIRILTWSTIIILILFIITVYTGLDLIETWSGDRNIGLIRNFMFGYGLINFIVPITISLYFLKFKLNKTLLFAFLLAIGIMFITIYRRDMISVLEYVIIISIMVSYTQKKLLWRSIAKYVNVKNIFIGTSVIIIINLFSSHFLKSSSELILGTLGSAGLVENSKTIVDSDQARLSFLGNIAIVSAIKDNFWLGTGFDRAWFTGDGGDKNWEGADYIFLSSFAMYGIVGLILFLPFYILSIKIIKDFLKLVRINYEFLYCNYHEFLLPVIVGLAASSEIIKNILEYPNWFYPIGALRDSIKFFIYFGLLLGSYYGIRLKLESYKN